jgi:hypothetical protein
MRRASLPRSIRLVEEGLHEDERECRVKRVRWRSLFLGRLVCGLVAIALFICGVVVEAQVLAAPQALADGCAPVFGRFVRALTMSNSTDVLWVPLFVSDTTSRMYRVQENSTLCPVQRTVSRHYSGNLTYLGGWERVHGAKAFCAAHVVEAWAGCSIT